MYELQQQVCREEKVLLAACMAAGYDYNKAVKAAERISVECGIRYSDAIDRVITHIIRGGKVNE